MPTAKQSVAARAKNTPSNVALVESFERHLRADGRALKTIAHYSDAAHHFFNFCDASGIPTVAGVRREHVEFWLESLYAANYARATVRNRFVGLHIFFKWLLEEGEVTRDPMEHIKRPVLEETRKDVVPKPDLDRVFTTLEKAKRWRDCAIIAIFYDTGIREAELANMLLENVDLDNGVLLVPHTKNKTVRRLAISPVTVRYIDRYLRQRTVVSERLLMGHRGIMTGNGLYQVVRAIFERMGFTVLIGPHDLRHTSASHLALSGLMDESAAMKLFGWKKPEMWRHYTAQVQEEAALNVHRKASPMANLPRKGKPHDPRA